MAHARGGVVPGRLEQKSLVEPALPRFGSASNASVAASRLDLSPDFEVDLELD